MHDRYQPTGLPVEHVVPELVEKLAGHPVVVLVAPPGSGKTTTVPPLVRESGLLAGGKLIMTEPRRVAARAAAARIAELSGGKVGDLVGYRVRNDHRVGPQTLMEIVTEGVLLRRLQRDPDLEGVRLVVFDEFHERSLDSDLALVLTHDAQSGLRPDLRILLMSATPDLGALGRVFPSAPVVTTTARTHPVSVSYRPRDATEPLSDAVVDEALRLTTGVPEGDILVFVPGMREIRQVVSTLSRILGDPWTVLGLHGSLPAEEQDRALGSSLPGERRVIVSTSLAETSVTVPGVTAVLDSGFRRRPVMASGDSFPTLQTVRISRSAATQRTGRAGRTAPGVCTRLWSAEEDRHLSEDDPPQITYSPLDSLVLQTAAWGARTEELLWPDPPPPDHLLMSRELLVDIGAVDSAGRITPRGRRMAGLPTDPRIAAILVSAAETGEPETVATAAALAAVLHEDWRPERVGSDLAELVTGFWRNRRVPRSVHRQARDWFRRLAGGGSPPDTRPDLVGSLLLHGYPDRVARRKPGTAIHVLTSGRGVEVGRSPISGDTGSPDRIGEWTVIADLGNAKVRRGDRAGAPTLAAVTYATVDRESLSAAPTIRPTTVDELRWPGGTAPVTGRRTSRLGELVLAESQFRPGVEQIGSAVVEAVTAEGIGLLPWSERDRSLLSRLRFLASRGGSDGSRTISASTGIDPESLSDRALARDCAEWLAPFLSGADPRSPLAGLDLGAALLHLAGLDRRTVDRLAPERLEVPSGSRLRVDYSAERPTIRVRVQEMFGATSTPAVLAGAEPVVLHLLSPAGRPVQVTDDIARFWRTSYPEVRREMRGRYPRHPWPEDPANATPTRRAKRRSR